MKLTFARPNGLRTRIPSGSINAIVSADPSEDQPKLKTVLFYDYGSGAITDFSSECAGTLYQRMEVVGFLAIGADDAPSYIRPEAIVAMAELDPEDARNPGMSTGITFQVAPNTQLKWINVPQTMEEIDEAIGLLQASSMPALPPSLPTPHNRKGERSNKPVKLN